MWFPNGRVRSARCAHAATTLSTSPLRLELLLLMQFPLLLLAQQPLTFSPEWRALGPFQIGTREAEWGADPLAAYGYAPATSVPSGMAKNGTAAWVQARYSDGKVVVGFGDAVEWEWRRDVLGWSGWQWQAWVHGSFSLPSSSDVLLYVSGAAAEVRVNGVGYFGDFYVYRRAPIVLRGLQGGEHKIEVRVAGDVRAFGAVKELEFNIEGRVLVADEEVEIGEWRLPEVVDERLAGKWGSVAVRNLAREWMEVTFEGGDKGESWKIAPGHTRPVRFGLEGRLRGNGTAKVEVVLRHRIGDGEFSGKRIEKEVNVVKDKGETQKYTYLHPSGIVSYAVLRPPICSNTTTSKAPILLSLHGAGVEAEWSQSRESFSALGPICAWLVLASGVTTWSGDDWHRWGWADVEAALSAITSDWIPVTKWTGVGANPNEILVTGHSNGGQGTWYALTHIPDRLLAAAPLSGYLSIPAYVPDHLWHEADPRKTAAHQAALSSYRHELLVGNAVGTPVLQMHGAEDDNVPVYQSRRMRQLLSEQGLQSEYWEMQGKGHWWDGVMTDGGLKAFYREHLEGRLRLQLKGLGDAWEIVVADPADMGSRGGIRVDQLVEPDRLGRVKVKVIGEGRWVIETENVRRFHFEKIEREGVNSPKTVAVDDEEFPAERGEATYLRAGVDGSWTLERSTEWKRNERSREQQGRIDALLTSAGSFHVVLPPSSSNYTFLVATEISRNFYQYFSADCTIATSVPPPTIPGNIVLINQLPRSKRTAYVDGNYFVVNTSTGRSRRHRLEPGMGAIFLQPREDGKGTGLVMVVWGVDEEGLRRAARLVPLRTGVGVPEFVLVGREAAWKGVQGAKALGVLDERWRVAGV